MSLPVDSLAEVVRAAADLAVRERAGGLDVHVKGRQDFVTHADRAVEKFLRPRLTELLPGSEVLGEEFGGPTEGDRLWIVDPIDGTTNYIRGLPHWCVSVALVEDGSPRLGAILAPATDELYLAEAGKGAWRNGARLRRTPVDPAKALINIGQSKPHGTTFFARLVTRLRDDGIDHRLLGSGALGLALAASGEVDGAIEGYANAWDVAAGLLIAREAGCSVNRFFTDGALRDGNPAITAAPGVDEAVFGAIEKALGEPVPQLPPSLVSG